MQALSLFLREGLTGVEEAISPIAYQIQTPPHVAKNSNSNSSGSGTGSSGGAGGSASSTSSSNSNSNAVSKGSSPSASTGGASFGSRQPAPFGESMIEGSVGKVLVLNPRLRLYDSYTNAFERLVGVCLSEIANRAGNVPQNEDVLLNFVSWEQSLRRNLTEKMWAQNPAELAGKWELIDIAGEGSLSPIMTNAPDAYFGMKEGLTVLLTKDGKVDVKLDGVNGLQWFFKPGPAHLDTCEFYLSKESDPDLLLKYTGFIDRGQRVESRFSKRSIRMTGRVISTIKGEMRASSRFIMALKRVD